MTASFIAAPSELRIRDGGRLLVVTFDGLGTFELPAEFLRVESPSAEVQGHTAREKKTVPGKRNIAITGAEPVGNYAIRLIFSDGHSSGLFTWETFADLGQNHGTKWAAYLANLAEKGLSRDP